MALDDPHAAMHRAAGGSAPAPAPPRTLFQISDLHLLAEGVLHGRTDTFANLELVLERLEASPLRPDLLVLSGDLADLGEALAYRRLRRRIETSTARLGAPALYLPGNHDDRRHLRVELLDLEPSDGPLDQLRWCGGLRVVALDTTVPGEDAGELGTEQLDWLRRTLSEPAPEGTVLVLHHPPVNSPIAAMSAITLARPEELAQALAGSDVRIVLAGHNHHATAAMLGTIPVWVGPATAYQADPLVPDGRFRGYPGAACSRIDLRPGSVLATAIVVEAGGEPVVDVEKDPAPAR